MADRVAQLVPAVAALGGVALTFVGTARLELQKRRAARRDANEERYLRAFSDLVRTITEIGGRLQATGQQLLDDRSLVRDALVRDIDDFVGQARREAALARLVGPTPMLRLIGEVDNELLTLHLHVVDVQSKVAAAKGDIDWQSLMEPAEHLITVSMRLHKLRDGLVEGIRDSQGLS